VEAIVISTKTKVVCPVVATVPDTLAIKRVRGNQEFFFRKKRMDGKK
jgi:hypothetical protein